MQIVYWFKLVLFKQIAKLGRWTSTKVNIFTISFSRTTISNVIFRKHPLKYRFYNVQTEPGQTLGLQKTLTFIEEIYRGTFFFLNPILKIFNDAMSDIMLF